MKQTALLRPIALLVCLLCGLTAVSWTLAQTTGESWGAPDNLSRSGAADAPQMVIDGNGRFHLWWSDSFAGLTYRNGRPGQWGSATAVTALPFAAADPFFLAAADQLHAFWRETPTTGIAPVSQLRHSAASAANAASPNAWSAPQTIQTNALALAAVAENGRLHVVTLRNDATSGGVYYQQSLDNGETWDTPLALDESGYLRLISAAQANVQLAAQGDRLWVAWDNQPEQTISLRQSVDGGERWSAPLSVGQLPAGTNQPVSGVRLTRTNEAVHLLWQAGTTGCTLYHQWLPDGAADWSPALPLPPGLPGCPGSLHLLADGPALYLLTRVADRSYLQGWQDGRWQPPQAQPDLDNGSAPGSGQAIRFDCGRDARIQGGQMWVAACGAAIGTDIWLLSRSLEPVRAALAATPVWRDPAPLSVADAAFFNPALVADEAGRFHAVWSQAAPGSQAATSLYYARWDPAASGWSRAVAIVTAPAGQQAAEPALARAGNQLYLVWRGGEQGEIFFSQADVNRAANPSDWSTPRSLPLPQPAGSAPTILPGPNDALYVAYAIPLNENRGIYLTESADGGDTWSSPSLIFDAVAAGWPQVAAPRLALTGSDQLHALWLRRGLPGSLTADTLYYAAAEANGRWSSPQEVTTGATAVGAVGDAHLLGWDRRLHRLWLLAEGQTGRQALWHQVSLDHGLTWSRAARVGGLGREAAAADLLLDGAGQPYLLALTAGGGGDAPPSLDLWRWVDDRWQSETGLTLAGAPPAGRTALAAALATNGRLGALYFGVSPAEGAAQIFFAEREIELSAILPTPLPSLTPTPTATPGPTATPAPQPTLTPFFPTERDAAWPLISAIPGTGSGQILFSAVLALFLGGLVVIGSLLLSRRRRRSSRVENRFTSPTNWGRLPVAFQQGQAWVMERVAPPKNSSAIAAQKKVARPVQETEEGDNDQSMDQPEEPEEADRSQFGDEAMILDDLADQPAAPQPEEQADTTKGKWRIAPAAIVTPLDLPILLFMVTSLVAYLTSYNPDLATRKLGLILLGVVIYYGLTAWQRWSWRGKRAIEAQAEAARQVAWGAVLFGAGLSLVFLATHDWEAYPAKWTALQRIGEALQALLPALPIESMNPNVIGGALVGIIPLAVALLVACWSKGWGQRVLAGLPLGVMLLAFLLTTSRGAWLALAAAAALWLLWQALWRISGRRRSLATHVFFALIAVTGVAFVVWLWRAPNVVGLLSRVWPGGQGRLDLYRDSIILLMDYPILGAGLDSFLMLHTTYSFLLHVGFSFHAHNLYLDIAIEQGLFGLAALLLLWGTAVFHTYRAMLRGSVNLWLAAGALALVAIAAHGMVDNTLYGSRALPLLFLPLAFIAPWIAGQPRMRPWLRWSWRLAFVGGLLLGSWVALDKAYELASISFANLSAVRQSKAELGLYQWPEWGLQDEVRQEVDLALVMGGYQRALRAWPDNPSAHRRLGQIQLSLGQYEAALEHLAAAYEATPWDNATRQLYGEALIVNGQVEEGAALWRTVHTAQNQLRAREYWYDFIGDNGRLALIRAALP